MELKKVGVVGAGVMGIGLAQSLAQSSLHVCLIDVSDAIIEKAKSAVKQNIRLQRLLNKAAGKQDDLLQRVSFSTDYGLLSDVDFVIENVTEKWPIKQEVYKTIDSICLEHVVFAANTSAIPITLIASSTRRPHNVIGMHFMNPVPMKKTVEVIRGFHTSQQTVETAEALLSAMGKESIIVNDSPGFVSNRVLMLMVNEAIFLLHENVATAEDIDRIFKECFGHKMGPLETADLIGLDTILYSIEVLYESFNDDKYRPCPLLKQMVNARLHGRKSGKGFYDYRTRNL
jgi:3-hydroxybutyryl-CoA dehydrogenase